MKIAICAVVSLAAVASSLFAQTPTVTIPKDVGGVFHDAVLGPQIGVVAETFQCVERFEMLNPQPPPKIDGQPSPKEVAKLVGKRTVTLYRPVFMKFDFKPQGREIYVGVDGKDTAAGTKEAPLKSINKAVALAKPGDHVVVLAGTYYELVRISGKKGTAEKPIVLRAADGVRPRIELPPGDGLKRPGEMGTGVERMAVVRLENVAFFQIHGFEVVGAMGREDEWPLEFNSAVGIMCDSCGDGFIISENIIHNNVHCGIKVESLKPYLAVGNLVYNNGASRHHDHGAYHHGDASVYLGNVFFANGGYAFHFYGTEGKHNLFRGNLIIENGFGEINDGPDNYFLNNVFARSEKSALYMWGEKSYNNVFVNNIFYQDKLAIDRVGYGDLPLPTGIFAANVFWPRQGGKIASVNMPESIWKVNGGLVADPGFENAAAYDFRLRKDSPCIEAGQNCGLPFKGKKPNIGAFE